MSSPSLPSSPAPVPPSELSVRMSPLAGVVLVLFFVCGLLSCVWAVYTGRVELVDGQPSWDALRNGEVTHRIADELANVPFPEHAARLERAASWLLIDDLGPRVREGCQGWLFIADELKVHPEAEANAATKARQVRVVQRYLASRGIDLIVAIVPDKSRIAHDALCGIPRPERFEARIRNWTEQLEGVRVVDLSPDLTPLGRKAFLRTDTHWSEAGAQAAATVLAEAVKDASVNPSPSKTLVATPGERQPRPGDLPRLAGLDWLPIDLQPAQELVSETQFETRSEVGQTLSEDDLFGDAKLPNITLIGTSFSQNSNFQAFLEHALGAAVGNFSKEGGEFSGAATRYFASRDFSETPPALVVWEIPERDLQTPFTTEILPDCSARTANQETAHCAPATR